VATLLDTDGFSAILIALPTNSFQIEKSNRFLDYFYTIGASIFSDLALLA